jgi:hypothetical protein
MKQVTHIAFFYIKERLEYLNKIIQNMNLYTHECDIYIHTNISNLELNDINYKNGSLSIIYHDLTNMNPFYLTWKPRDTLKYQIDQYDIFMYIEDDILVPLEAIEYWLKYKDQVLINKCNLGFFRIEVDNKGDEYCTDQHFQPYLTKTSIINNETYIINDINPYCGFWIYDRNEFIKFVNSPCYNINNIRGYGIRESSAIGLHGLETPWYNHTLIPLINKSLIPQCKVYHLPNNYLQNCNLHKFKDVCKL